MQIAGFGKMATMEATSATANVFQSFRNLLAPE